jgi:trans-2-enoyl-CoA reductase
MRHERGPNADFDKVSDRLKNLGAAEVLPDEGNLRRVLYTGPHTTPSAW